MWKGSPLADVVSDKSQPFPSTVARAGCTDMICVPANPAVRCGPQLALHAKQAFVSDKRGLLEDSRFQLTR